MNPSGLLRMQEQIVYSMAQIQLLKRELKDVSDLVLETADMTGGPGWPATIQNAIMQLDQRLDMLKSVMIQHQQNFEQIEQETVVC